MKPIRLARLLAERLDEEDERVGAALTVGELLDRYVPYEVARGSLELATKSEYDLVVLEFLADRRLIVLRDPVVGEVATEELETPEPGLASLRDHRDVALRLDLATISGGYRGGEDGEDEEPSVDAAWDPTGGVEARPVPEEDQGDTTARPEQAGAPDDAECRDCGRALPLAADVSVRFCPHCGTARPDRSCPECGTRLRPDWSYCPACGARA